MRRPRPVLAQGRRERVASLRLLHGQQRHALPKVSSLTACERSATALERPKFSASAARAERRRGSGLSGAGAPMPARCRFSRTRDRRGACAVCRARSRAASASAAVQIAKGGDAPPPLTLATPITGVSTSSASSANRSSLSSRRTRTSRAPTDRFETRLQLEDDAQSAPSAPSILAETTPLHGRASSGRNAGGPCGWSAAARRVAALRR